MLTRLIPGLSVALTIAALPVVLAQDSFGDSEVMIVFQRATDAYAFAHRQIERRAGTADQREVSARLKASRATATEGALITPAVAAALRRRIAIAIRTRGCGAPEAGGVNFVVPGVNASADGTFALNACLTNALPRLPDELQYRSAGVALVLADAHHGIVVDVLHAAFPIRD